MLVDPLREDDLRRARATPPAEKLLEALEMMEMGLAMKRATLRRMHVSLSESAIDGLLEAWILQRE